MCLIKELAPITFTCGFIEGPISILEECVVPWRQSIGLQVSMTPVESRLSEALLQLDPLSSMAERELWVETDSPWLACFTNGIILGPGPVGYLAGRCKRRAVTTRCSPSTMPSKVTKSTRGNWGGTALELYGPDNTEWLNCVRSIAAANDGGNWVFETFGKALPFEQTERYLAARNQDRFTPEMLESYCKAMGIDVFNQSFYKGCHGAH